MQQGKKKSSEREEDGPMPRRIVIIRNYPTRGGDTGFSNGRSDPVNVGQQFNVLLRDRQAHPPPHERERERERERKKRIEMDSFCSSYVDCPRLPPLNCFWAF